MLTVPRGGRKRQLVDDGGDVTLVMHRGTELEAAFAKDGTLPDPNSTTNQEFKTRLDGHEQFHGPHQGGQVGCTRLTTDGQAYGEERLEKKGGLCKVDGKTRTDDVLPSRISGCDHECPSAGSTFTCSITRSAT